MAVGDSIGAPLEFEPVRYEAHIIRDMGKGARGVFRLYPGQYTDDTAMGLCLADSLLATHGEFQPLDLMQRFLAWWYFGYNNAFAADPVSIKVSEGCSAVSSLLK